MRKQIKNILLMFLIIFVGTVWLRTDIVYAATAVSGWSSEDVELLYDANKGKNGNFINFLSLVNIPVILGTHLNE